MNTALDLRKARYQALLQKKVALAKETGFEVSLEEINQILFRHQPLVVQWAVHGGCRALFESFGLGKTIQQLEIIRLILLKSGGERGLIVHPLGVRQEFKNDAAKLGTPVRFIQKDSEIDEPGIYLTNYESVREGKLNPTGFQAVSLDEAACLRGFGSTKTFREFMGAFEGTSIYRFVATATPSPNEFIELLSYAAFLGIMEVSEAKTRWFKRDSTHADKLTLHEHKKQEFWLWVSSWAVFLQSPSDLGFSDEGYDLPPLDVRWHEVPSDYSKAGYERDGQGRLVPESRISVQSAAKEKRNSLPARIAKLMEIRAEDPSAHRVIWHDLEPEREAIEKSIPGIATVYGTQKDLNERERLVTGFANGEIPELAGKPSMLGAGTNMQRFCHWEIFLGVGFKFYQFIQAIHRVQRFLQTHPVRIDIIYTEAERGVRKELERKWAQHEELVAAMGQIIREFGLSQDVLNGALNRSIGIERRVETGRDWTAVNNDCVLETQQMEESSVDLVVTSIPFSTQYEYTPSYNDFGHNEDNEAFFEQMDFLTPELLRVLRPGRVAAIHVKDRIAPGGLTGLGFETVQPFHCETINHFIKHGFAYLGMKTVTTDVVRENNQTYRLTWSEQVKDGSRMGVGMPEYLLLFRKPQTDRSRGYADVKVEKQKPLCDDHGSPAPFDPAEVGGNWHHPIPGTGYSCARWQIDAHGYARSSGERLLSSDELANLPHEKLFKLWRERSTRAVYDFAGHVAIMEELDYKERMPTKFMLMPPHSWHPDVWSDITRMRTLNGAQSAKGKEMHLCAMQLDLIERAIQQHSMLGELILDPFGGIGSTAYVALQMKRQAYSIELSAGYWADSVYYCKAAEAKAETPTLFDLMAADNQAGVD